MIARVYSGSLRGVDGYLVEVEVDIAFGLPHFTTVGLPENAVKESKDRVKAALKNSGLPYPASRITINLAPADVRKEGTGFDLPIAVGLLAAQGQINGDRLAAYLLYGELSLDGRLKPTHGVLPMALTCRERGFPGIILPRANAREAAVVREIDVIGVETLTEVADFLQGRLEVPPEPAPAIDLDPSTATELDFADVKGQEQVKRAMLVAAAGGHNILLVGPPGTGKTMMARRLPSILPPLAFEEALETSKVYSIMGLLPPGQALLTTRPFRPSHHTISDAGLVGGGRNPRPGEVSLAHHGVLFLDELPEFKRQVLEVLRQPLEDGVVTLSRASGTITYPARFMLVAAMNPCPCGYLGDPRKPCRCTPKQIQSYQSRVSGPLLDRIDLQVVVPAVPFKDLAESAAGLTSQALRDQVVAARTIQSQRFAGLRTYANAQMSPRLLKKYGQVDDAGRCLLESAMDRLGLSARAHNRILKIARTIADLEGQQHISPVHLAEAIQYRSLDRRLA